MICIRQINGCKDDILIGPETELIITVSFTQAHLDICAVVSYKMSKLRTLARLSVQYELICLIISGTAENLGATGAFRNSKYFRGTNPVLGEKENFSFVTSSDMNIQFERSCHSNQSDALA